MSRLEEHVQIESRVAALKLLENSSYDRPRKTGTIRDKCVSLRCQPARARLLRRCIRVDTRRPAPDRDHVCRKAHVDCGCEAIDAISIHRKPAGSVKQVSRVITD